MIIITNPHSIVNEFQIIQQLFEEGLVLLHIRKPDYSENEMRSFLSNIDVEFYSKLVLHEQHHLTSEYGINRIHFKEKDRIIESPARFTKPCRYSLKYYKKVGFTLSTSVHNINDFNELSKEFDYAFLSPVFPSISKPDYKSEDNLLGTIYRRTNFNTELIALGGINENNTQIALDSGFDSVALLGSIWLSDNPIQNFKKCQKIVHS